ncbi:BBT_HP_G0004210.mRNA.1.CDS.1 [Saccharomyces cerevisiae]|nr:BBT_HP_G0017560.mRNA.1.CDS.1 [Saccharomyces cerevisiae]CAI5058335.1 BBT_HP_G0004210.mRNA.1.CDS.1 [Saccharomyces cerevisiae]CAI6395143.1 BBT_HP_G0017560.mRNA.1.CDS.1 [Saccharomyces cerevisiae]CAI6959852.1 BBT_HP_G0004210.mRNA.1.CDS.1 [Saccharomyces cerevisiae]
MSFNLSLYENKAWNAEYFFSNAAHCPEAFRTTLLEPFCLKEDKNAKIKSFKDSIPFHRKSTTSLFYRSGQTVELDPY